MRIFDFSDAVKRLSHIGIPENHASEIIHTIIDMHEHDLNQLASHSQVENIEENINQIKDQVRELEGKFEKLEIKVDNFSGEIKDLKFDIFKWIMPLSLNTAINHLNINSYLLQPLKMK